MGEELENKISNILKEILEGKNKKRIQMFDCEDIMGDYKVCFFDEDGVKVLYAPRI